MAGSYDQVRYHSLPRVQTHPDRLATIAALFGLPAAPSGKCRVLELGCGDGGNLIPMALGMPRSEFMGIDLAVQAIEQGRAVGNALGLKNFALLQLDLMEAGPELGEFDYIIAHGVYSWAPAEVREQLLRICRANLAPHGVAYVSYNAYPGFHRREMFREMMLYHVSGVEDPEDRVRQAVELVTSLNKQRLDSQLTRALFAEELCHLTESEWWYVYHDDLAPSNHASYFHEFVTEARRHGLEYLAEADFFEMQDELYAEPIVEALRRFSHGDVVRNEQYLDFIKGRRFRQTLLCRAEVALDRSPRPEQLTTMYFASAASPVSPAPDLRPGVFEEFRGPRGAALGTDDPQAKIALWRLNQIWPQSRQFAELLAETGGDALPLAEVLFRAYSVGLLEVHMAPPLFAARAGERPVASQLARLQAQNGSLVTTLRHTTAELEDAVDRGLLLLLDGTRDRTALADSLQVFLRLRAIAGADSVTAESIEARLERLAKQALLVA